MPDDYIKRSDVMTKVPEWFVAFLHGEAKEYLDKAIAQIPAADVEPVRHGRWIDENPASFLDPRMRCSVCGHVDLPLAKWRFCPMCGARMDEEEDSGNEL